MNTTKLESHAAVAGQVEREVRLRADDVLHCYAQHSWHTEAYISGTRDALEALRAAIDRALVDEVAECQAFAADGEGYTVYVVAMSVADAERQVVPYTSDIAAQPWSGQAFGPWDALSRHNVGDELRP
jgi:hypothetical protein